MASVVPNDHTARADMLTTSAPRPDVELLFEDDVTSVCSDEVVAPRATPTSTHDHAVHTHRMGALWMCPHGLRHAECGQCPTLPAAAAVRGNALPDAAARPAPSTRPSSRRNLPRTNTAPFKHLPKHEQARLASDAKETRKQEMATEAYHLERAKTKKAKERAAEAAGGAGDTVRDAPTRLAKCCHGVVAPLAIALFALVYFFAIAVWVLKDPRLWGEEATGAKRYFTSLMLFILTIVLFAFIGRARDSPHHSARSRVCGSFGLLRVRE